MHATIDDTSSVDCLGDYSDGDSSMVALSDESSEVGKAFVVGVNPTSRGLSSPVTLPASHAIMRSSTATSSSSAGSNKRSNHRPAPVLNQVYNPCSDSNLNALQDNNSNAVQDSNVSSLQDSCSNRTGVSCTSTLSSGSLDISVSKKDFLERCQQLQQKERELTQPREHEEEEQEEEKKKGLSRMVVLSPRKTRNRLAKYTVGSSSRTLNSSLTGGSSLKFMRPPPPPQVPEDGPTRGGSRPCVRSKVSPQMYLDTLARSRGYIKPTPQSGTAVVHANTFNRSKLRRASFGFFTVGVTKLGDAEALHELLSAGLSPNACNKHGTSLVHIVCRRGDHRLLRVLLKFGCDFDSLVDDNGRTPLHDVCCCDDVSSALEAAKLIINYCHEQSNEDSKDTAYNDIMNSAFRLFYKADNTGALPMAYIQSTHWSEWLEFLAEEKDEYLPEASTLADCRVPVYAKMKKPWDSRHSPLTPEVAQMVASGKLAPDQAIKYAIKTTGGKSKGKRRSTTASARYKRAGKPLPKAFSEQERDINNILSYVDKTIMHRRKNSKSGQNKKQHSRFPNVVVSNFADTSDVDSTAFPDSVSGVEFYTDSYHKQQDDDLEGHDPSDVDSTAFPDSVSGVEFYCDSDHDVPPGVEDDDENDIDVDSTAFPDSVSGVEFYCESVVPSIAGADDPEIPRAVSGVKYHTGECSESSYSETPDHMERYDSSKACQYQRDSMSDWTNASGTSGTGDATDFAVSDRSVGDEIKPVMETTDLRENATSTLTDDKNSPDTGYRDSTDKTTNACTDTLAIDFHNVNIRKDSKYLDEDESEKTSHSTCSTDDDSSSSSVEDAGPRPQQASGTQSNRPVYEEIRFEL